MTERPASQDAASAAVDAAAATGAGRPTFAAAFPKTAAVDELVALFSAGRYAELRERAAAVRKGDDEKERIAAAELVARTEADPTARLALILAALLLALLSAHWTTHAGRGRAPAASGAAAP